MLIIFDKPKLFRKFVFRGCALLILLCMLGYKLWPNAKTQSVSRLEVSPTVFAFPLHAGMDEPLPQPAGVTSTAEASQRVFHEPNKPRHFHGALAAGQPNAGDVERDSFGNPCTQPTEILPTAQLREKLLPQGDSDPCGYRYMMLTRNDATPEDVLAVPADFYFFGGLIQTYAENDLWSVSDLEKLAHRRLLEGAVLSLYLVLRDRDSRQASLLASRRDEGIMREFLDYYLEHGVCPSGFLQETLCVSR